MAAMPSIRVVKTFPYRGVAKTYSNRYHFSGGTPADSTHWTTLSDAIVTAEKAVHAAYGGGGCMITETFGYEAGSEIPVFSKTYATDGTYGGSGQHVPGDVAGIVRYSTAARSTKNHPIYMFSYYHGVLSNGAVTTADTWVPAQVTAHGVYAALWVSTGFSDGTHTVKRTSPTGHDATGYVANTLLTHRDLVR